MMSILDGFPDDVIGIVARGRVTRKDYDEVLRPAVQRSLTQHAKLRLYYEISSRFPGAAWDDLKEAGESCTPWARIAVVTDVGWIRHTVNALRFVIPAEIRVFPTVQASEGRAWIIDRQ
jgi:hypothetical protein